MRFMLPILAVWIVVISASSVLAQDAPPGIESSEPEATAMVLPAGVPVKLVLLETLRSQSNHKGDMISFEVVEDVQVQGQVIIPKGALAYGQITDLKSRRGLGKSGNLQAEIYHILLPGGTYIPLVTDLGEAPGGQGGKMLYRWLFFGPFGGLTTKGKKVTIDRGLELDVFVAEETTMPLGEDYSEAKLRLAIDTQKEELAISAVKRFGFGTKKIEDLLAEKGLAPEATWAAARHDDYTYLVTVAGPGQSYSWLVNPFQEAHSKKFRSDRIKGVDKASEDIISAVD